MAQVDLSRLATSVGFAGAAAIALYGGYDVFFRSPPAAPVAVEIPRAPIAAASVLVAAKSITRGDVIDAAMLRPLALASGPPPGAAITPDQVIGKVALTDIAVGQIVQADLVSADPARAGLAVLVPDGYRAMAVRISDEIAVSNLVHPGDLVDLTLVLRENVLSRNGGFQQSRDPSEARTLLQRVKVLTVGETLADQPPKDKDHPSASSAANAARTLTLALTPEEGELVTLARSLGTYGLALRNPTDTAEPTLPTIGLGELQGLMATKQVADTRRPIELILGSQRRVIYSINPPSPPRRLGSTGLSPVSNPTDGLLNRVAVRR